MNRRGFLISGFILGLNIALGNKLKAVEAEEPARVPVRGGFTFDGVNPYWNAKPFTLEGPQTVYFVGQQVNESVSWPRAAFNADGVVIEMRPAPSC